MAFGSDQTQLPPAKCPNESSYTTIDSLGGDILREIFLRLPSLTSLIRAAFTCRAWRHAVSSSPRFRRQFRELHPAPPLGLFFATFRLIQHRNGPAFPAFVPSRRPDRDQAAAVRCGDFFLTSIQDRPDGPYRWDIIDCRDGFVLLHDWDKGLLVLMNPLSKLSYGFIDMPNGDIFEDHRGFYHFCSTHLIYSDDDPMSFRLVCLALDESRVRAAIFSSDTRDWHIHPWVEVSPRPQTDSVWLLDGTQANGLFVYWVSDELDYVITLDLTTIEFSVVDLPQCLMTLDQDFSFDFGETKHGAPCIVYAAELSIGILLRRTDDDGIEKWVQDIVVSLRTQIIRELGGLPDGLNRMYVAEIRNGFVYLTTKQIYHGRPHSPCWFLSFCLETMKLEKLFQGTIDGEVYPYVLSWPRSLVGDYGRFAHQVAP